MAEYLRRIIILVFDLHRYRLIFSLGYIKWRKHSLHYFLACAVAMVIEISWIFLRRERNV
ncbi:MAG: hypothetical protein AB1643_02540 [Patescibacteria group bacterium]